MVRFQRTNKATNEKNWLVINWIDDNPDCTWTDDYDASDVFENEELGKEIVDCIYKKTQILILFVMIYILKWILTHIIMSW